MQWHKGMPLPYPPSLLVSNFHRRQDSRFQQFAPPQTCYNTHCSHSFPRDSYNYPPSINTPLRWQVSRFVLFSRWVPMAQPNKPNLIAPVAVTLHLWELTSPRTCFQVPMTEADKGPQRVPYRQRGTPFARRCTQVKRNIKPTQGPQIWLLDFSRCYLENSVTCLEATSKCEPGEKSLPSTLFLLRFPSQCV